MTFEELLKACAAGFLPRVKLVDGDVRIPIGREGQVTVIKQNDKHKGCAVQFDEQNYDTWFTDMPTATDKRSRYMHQLVLI